MATGGQIGSGIKVAYAIGSPHTWIRVPQVLDVPQLPYTQRDQVDVTTHGTTSIRSKIPGLAEVQDTEILVLPDLDPTSVHMDIRELERTQDTVWWRIEIPNTSNLATTHFMAYEFQGKVSGWSIEAPIDGRKEATITVLYVDNYMAQKTMASQIT